MIHKYSNGSNFANQSPLQNGIFPIFGHMIREHTLSFITTLSLSPEMTSFGFISNNLKSFGLLRVTLLQNRTFANVCTSFSKDSGLKTAPISDLVSREGRCSRRLHFGTTITSSRGLASRFTNMDKAQCTQLDRSNVQEFLDSFDTILTDCDGKLF